ncbi:MAG TPA: hypothetical protein VHB02_08175 [Acidimicrobiales bacterium]|nr:hypothetical protein [Acidimicrobiales bacterium]
MLTCQSLARIVAAAPAAWASDRGYEHRVILPTRHVTIHDLLAGAAVRHEDIETIVPGRGVVYWSIRHDAVGRSGLTALARQPIYEHLTVRSHDLLVGLRDLADQAEPQPVPR